MCSRMGQSGDKSKGEREETYVTFRGSDGIRADGAYGSKESLGGVASGRR